MSDISNPYRSPEAGAEVIKPLISYGTLTASMVKNLVDASPWLRFMGIMGFIVSGLYALGGIIALIAMPLAMRVLSEASSFLSVYLGGGIGIALIYAVILIGAGALMFFPAFFTYRFGSKLRSFSLNNSEQELELAFKNNKSLWKFNGILMIVGLAVLPVFIIIGIVIAVAAMAIG